MNFTTTVLATNTTSTKCVEIKNSAISDLLMSVYIIVFIFGLIFNLLILGPIWLQMRRQNVLGIFLLHLSISDMLYIFTLPLWINYYLQDHSWQLGVTSCSVAGFFYYSNMYISIMLLCCISVDRCLVITYPIHSKRYRTSCYAWTQCIIVYVVGVLLHVLILIKDELKDAHDDTHGQDRCYETFPMKRPVAFFNLFRVGFGFLLPLLILTLSYWKVLATVGRSPGLNANTKRKVRLLSFGVIGIFSLCFAPYHIFLFIRSLVFYGNPENLYCEFEQNMHFSFSCTLALSSLNAVVDPVLYVLVSNGVQEEMKMCWRRLRRSKADSNCALTAYSRQRPDSNLI